MGALVPVDSALLPRNEAAGLEDSIWDHAMESWNARGMGGPADEGFAEYYERFKHVYEILTNRHLYIGGASLRALEALNGAGVLTLSGDEKEVQASAVVLGTALSRAVTAIVAQFLCDPTIIPHDEAMLTSENAAERLHYFTASE